MIKSGIYGLINIVTGKVYVGQAFNIKKRWTNHEVELRLERHCNPYLQASWNKYNEAAFIFIVLEYCGQEILTAREQHWMDRLKACDREFGYNQAPAAGSLVGFKHTEKTKQAWSDYRKANAKPRSDEIKAKIAATTKGRIVSDETKELMRQAKLGKKFSEETKAKMSKSKIGNSHNKGRKQSTEEIEIRRNSNIGKKRSIEFSEALSARTKGRILSEETKERMRQSALNRKDRQPS